MKTAPPVNSETLALLAREASLGRQAARARRARLETPGSLGWREPKACRGWQGSRGLRGQRVRAGEWGPSDKWELQVLWGRSV